MGLIKNFLRRVSKKFDGFYSQTYLIAPSLNTADYLRSYGEVGWLFACVSTISGGVADNEWNAVRKNDAGEEEVVKSRMLEILMKPNPFVSFYDFMELHEMYMELTGKCYWYIAKDRLGRPQEIYLINPMYVVTYPDKDNFIKGYGYRAGMEEIPLDVDEVIFFNFPNPLNPYDGVSPAKSVADSIESHKYANDYNKNFFYNGAEPKGIVNFPEVNDDDYEVLKERWRENYGGVDNAHKTAFIRGSQVSYTAIQISQKDMDFFNLKIQSRDEILGAYGVPKSILGIVEDVNRSNADTAEYTYAKHTIKPRLRKIQEKLNNEFVPLFKEETGVTFKFVDPVPENRDFIKSIIDSQTDKSLTKNESRNILNKLLGLKLKPLIGGDIIYQPVSQQPMGTPIPTQNSSQQYGKEDDVQDTLIENEPSKNLSVKKKKLLYLRKKFENLDKETYWKAFVAKTDDWEKKLKPIWNDIFKHQKEEIISKIKSHKSLKAAGEENLLNFLFSDDETKYIVENILPVLQQIMKDKGNQVMNELELNTSFDLHNPLVTEWLSQYCATQIHGINSTTESLIREQLKQGEEAGESIAELCSRIDQYFDNMEGYRVQRIARTEVIGASNNATLIGYKQSGVVGKKQWLTAIDGREREWHAEADGQTVGINEKFIVGGEELDCPGDPAGSAENIACCRCTLIPNFDEDIEDAA